MQAYILANVICIINVSGNMGHWERDEGGGSKR